MTNFTEPPEGLLTAPTNRVIAHLDTAEAAAGAIDALAEAGFDRDEIFVLCGREGAERLDVSGEQHGIKGRIYRLLEWLGDEHEVLLESEKHLEGGGLVIAVPSGEDDRETASRIIRERGGHDIVYFGEKDWQRLGA